ncbi:MAG: Uma2 family endonuclease [Anaerolineae bacterium]|nr:Uma2 family endonuclease [Anaerolineae bacterium]
MQESLAVGVQLVWVVDPRLQQVYVYTVSDEVVRLGKADKLTGGDVLPGFVITVGELFI